MKKVIKSIYDNGGETIDRYTVFFHDFPGDYLGLSEGGVSVSMWGECEEGPHLGKKIKWDELSHETKTHIIARLCD